MTSTSAARPPGRRLNALLARLVWVCMGPLLCLAAYLAFADVSEVHQQREVRARAIVASVARAIDQDLNGRIGALQILAHSPLAADPALHRDLYREALGFQRSFGGRVILAGLDLQMLFNTGEPFGAELPRLPQAKGRMATPIAIATGRPAVGDVLMGPITGEPLVAIAVPVMRGERVETVLLSTLDVRQFQQYLDASALLDGSSLTLSDSGGTVIARRLPPGATEAGPSDERGHFTAASKLAPWTVALDIPRSTYLAPLLRVAAVLAAAILAATAAGLAGGRLVGRRLSQAVTALARPAEANDARIAEVDAVRALLDEAARQHAESEATLRRSEQRFRRLFEDAPVAFALLDRNGTMLDLNTRFVELFGYSRAELGSVEDWRRLAYDDPADRESSVKTWSSIAAEGQLSAVDAMERRVRCKDGSQRDVLMSGLRIADDFLATLIDMTEHRRAEESSRRLAAIVQSSDDAIIGKTLDGTITSWNPGAEKLFGHTEAEAIGRPMQILIPPDRRGEEEAILSRIRRGETVEHFETVRVRRDGGLVDISATISPIHDSRGTVVGASKIARNITDRRHSLLRLQAQLERLQLLDQLTTAIGERQDLASIHQVVLRRLEERLPVDFSCMLGADAGAEQLEVLGIGPASAQRAWQAAMGEGQVLTIEEADRARCVRCEVIQEEDSANPAVARFPFSRRLADCGLRALVLAPVCSERGLVGALLVARAEPHSFSSGECEFLRQLCAHVGLADQQARLHEALQGAYDELRQTQQAVMQQERLRALGQMASGVAHDINNAIAPVLLYSETLLEHEPDLSARARKYLQTIARSIDDVAATVARLREFYRPEASGLHPAMLQLAPLVEQVMELTRARWHDMPLQRGVVVEARMELAPDLPAVMGIESEIREALINLVFNAVDAMPDGGTLTLSAQPGEGGTVALSVADTGVGMDEATRRRCIEPFFTTKGERGTGLGLAMVYGIAQRHGAELRVDSAPGRGTVMTLVFSPPATDESAAPLLDSPAPQRRLHLLVVDDDPVVLASLRETLEMDGHHVRTADGGQGGIDAFDAALRAGTGFDAVITDLGMPYVDGRQLALAIKERSPATPVILATGWGQRLVADGDVPPHVDRVLTKPPKLRELRAALAEVTDPR